MSIFEKKTTEIKEERKNEMARAETEKLQATMEYLAAMLDVELPDQAGEEEGDE